MTLPAGDNAPLRHVVHITVVFGGMLSSTLLAIPFVPVFYVALERLSERLRKSKNSQ